MTIKSKMLLIILLGIGGLFIANFYSSAQLNAAHKNYSSEESLTAHSSAWFSNMDTQFVSNLLTFDPLTDPSAMRVSGTQSWTRSGIAAMPTRYSLPSVLKTPKLPPRCLSRYSRIQSWRSKSHLLLLTTTEAYSCIASQVSISSALIHAKKLLNRITF